MSHSFPKAQSLFSLKTMKHPARLHLFLKEAFISIPMDIKRKEISYMPVILKETAFYTAIVLVNNAL